MITPLFRFIPSLPLCLMAPAVLLLPSHGVLAQSTTDWAKVPGASPDPKRPGIIVAPAAQALTVATPVLVPHDPFAVWSITVEDGPAAMDLVLSGGLADGSGTAGGVKSGGWVKQGAGSMQVLGPVNVQGVVTVYDGSLDLSGARLSPGMRVNILGKAKLIPPAGGTPVSEIYVNGEKLAPGTWGPPGSVAGGQAANESPALGALAKLPDTGPSRREIWQGLKYGIFSHYVWNGYGMTAGTPKADGTRAQTIDEMAESFDVENYVAQLVDVEAQYVVFTAWHSGTCPLFPSAAMAKWAPGRPSCPKHDLLGRLLDACRAKGIRTFFYCHPFQPVAEPHNDWINDLFSELADRYGARLDGLWIDENFQDCTQDKAVDYRRLMKTIKERNPDLVLTHNNGGYQSYGVDEGVQEIQWEYHEGRMSSTYQIFNQTAKSPEDMLVTTIIQAAANTMGGGIQWSIDAHGPGANTPGGLDAGSRPILDGFVKLFRPMAEAVKNTRPSSSYPPPFSGAVVKLANLPWGVATKSHDDGKEFLHVLKAPDGNSLVLPPPADGKVFANARLLVGGRPVSLAQSNRGITLKLPDGVAWQKPVTVIALDVIAPGGVGMINNTSHAVEYHGRSWRYQREISSRDFRLDTHRASEDGDAFVFTFEGTDVAWISGRGPDRGVVDLAIDGVSHGSVDLSRGTGNFQTVFSKSGLPRGRHTLTGTKRGGKLLTVDAFRVSELINDGETGRTFQETTRFGATAAALTGPWEPRGGSWINGQSFRFTFHGTGVEIFGGSAHGSGDLVVTLNGQTHSTAHCHGGQTTRSLVKITGLPPQEHTVVGQFTNPHPAGFISAFDGFTVTRPDFWAHRKNRGLGELGDDAHVSELKGSTGSHVFHGSGVEILTTRDVESRTVHYTLDGGGSSLWVGLNHYSPVTLAGSSVFRYPNLLPGRYTVGFSNAANRTGVNFSFVRLNIDGLRIHKGESSSASPLFWGENAAGGDGTWDVGSTANWHDGVSANKWMDLGARDYAAVFAGKPGTVVAANAINANRLTFRASGYLIQGEGITLTGPAPTLAASRGVVATLGNTIAGGDGLVKSGEGAVVLTGTNTYAGGTTIQAGMLVVGSSGTLGSGTLTIGNGATCKLENPTGGLASGTIIHLAGDGRLAIASGVTAKVEALILDGTVQPAGEYRAATHPAIVSGEGVLLVSGTTPPAG